MKDPCYMLVSDDDLELPLCVAGSVQELASRYGLRAKSISGALCRGMHIKIRKARGWSHPAEYARIVRLQKGEEGGKITWD